MLKIENNIWIRIDMEFLFECLTLLFIHQPNRVARKASDVLTADWRYQRHVKKYRIFSRVLLRLFSGLEILV